jgi:hypothetical protein
MHLILVHAKSDLAVGLVHSGLNLSLSVYGVFQSCFASTFVSLTFGETEVFSQVKASSANWFQNYGSLVLFVSLHRATSFSINLPMREASLVVVKPT